MLPIAEASMQCPACQARIGLFRNPRFRVAYALKRVGACPYCQAALHRANDPIWLYFQDILFAIFLIGVIFSLLAMVFGAVVGYQTALVICFWFWAIAVVVVGVIVLLNVFWAITARWCSNIGTRAKQGGQREDQPEKGVDHRGQ